MMARFDKAGLLTAPTIEQRVELGRQQNSIDNGAIVPFAASWNTEMLDVTFRRGGGKPYFAYLNEGYERGAQYLYRSSDGQIILAVQRLNRGSEKQLLPIRATRIVGCDPGLEIKSLEAFRPLYNLPGLIAEPTKSVLITEGEKAADAAKLLFPDSVATTWLGGSGSVATADWRPLIGRKVLI